MDCNGLHLCSTHIITYINHSLANFGLTSQKVKQIHVFLGFICVTKIFCESMKLFKKVLQDDIPVH